MKRLLLWLFVVVPVLVVGVGFALLSALSNEALIVACLDPMDEQSAETEGPLLALPPGIPCGYLTSFRDPDPNQMDDETQQSLLGFTLAGHDAADNVRSQALLEHFIKRGIQWDQPHSGLLTPLHLAVLYHSEALVRRFLEAGANPRSPVVAPGRRMHGLDAFDFARFLRTAGEQSEAEKVVKTLLQLEALLCDNKSVNARASIKAMPKVSIDPKTHRMLGYWSFIETYLYAAENFEQIPLGLDPNRPPKPTTPVDPLDEVPPTGIWGAIGGPLGDQKEAMLGFASVWDFDEATPLQCGLPSFDADPLNLGAECGQDIENPVAPSFLEANLGVEDAEIGEMGGLKFDRFKLSSRRSRPEKPARLRRITSIGIQDVDQDGQFEVLASADFAIGCSAKPYSEDFVLKVIGDKVVRIETGSERK